MQQHTFIEVCAGGGGLSKGLVKSGFAPLLLNDLDKDCCKTLHLNHPETKIVCCSMEQLNIEEYRGKVDLFCGGVPCQSYSQAGLRKGLEDPRGQLISIFAKMIYTLEPKMFMVENVKGLMTHNSGETIKEIISILNKESEAMYDIQNKLLCATDYGVPQKRERVFIIGTRKIENLKFEYPIQLNDILPVLKTVLTNVPESEGAKYTEEKKKLFKMIPQGGCWINLPEELQKSYLGNSYYSGGGKRGILYRLSMEKPSLTLLCSPSQKQTERCHPLEERPLTTREYARIQTFDDSYEFVGKMASKYKQIGNAVPVELAKHMGLAIIQCLERINSVS